MSTLRSSARLNFRLPAELKRTIEAAASQRGQSVSEFALAALRDTARQVLHDEQVTQLSQRDRAVFMALLENKTAKPNPALRTAATRYKRQVK